MAKRPTLADLTSLTNSSAINTLSQNWDAIEEAFDNTLSLDGSTPNAMNADLDLNGNGLLNVGAIDVENLTLNGQTVTDLATVPEWRGAWVTATNYAKNDLVKTAGNVYICLVSHTSAAAFNTDLTALRWELMVSKGDSGVGSGDLVSTNNLSDLTDASTARANLGLGTVAVESTVPVNKGGTGATDAATARTNLSAQTSHSNLTDISGLAPTKGRLIVGNGANWIDLGVGTDGYSLEADSSAVSGLKWNASIATAIAEAAAGAPRITALAMRDTYLGTGSSSAGGFSSFTQAAIAATERLRIDFGVASASAGSVSLQIGFSTDGGTNWGTTQTLANGTVAGSAFGAGMITVNLRTGGYAAYLAHANALLDGAGTTTVPANVNAVRVRISTTGSVRWVVHVLEGRA